MIFHTPLLQELPEAAMAGILGVKSRGPQWYHGVFEEAPFIGNRKREVETVDILKAIANMIVCTDLFYILFSLMRLGFERVM